LLYVLLSTFLSTFLAELSKIVLNFLSQHLNFLSSLLNVLFNDLLLLGPLELFLDPLFFTLLVDILLELSYSASFLIILLLKLSLALLVEVQIALGLANHLLQIVYRLFAMSSHFIERMLLDLYNLFLYLGV
jgi:hypothetical protein